jgi:hypothetical protein
VGVRAARASDGTVAWAVIGRRLASSATSWRDVAAIPYLTFG